jgi:hypothetical protein
LSEIEQEVILDPIYGAEIKNYPSDRGRLLLIGGAIYFTMGFLVNAAFASVDASTAAIVVIGTMALLAVIIGWFILHLWNREVVLYERGFSYVEGSRTIFFLYSEVVSIKQEAERVSYFGGLLRRTITRITIKTKEDETIVLDRIYRRIDELSVRLESLINRAKRPIVEAKLAQGSEVSFGDVLHLTPIGIKVEDRLLVWDDYVGYRIGEGKLHLDAKSTASWGSISLSALENSTLLLEILQSHKL